MISVCLRKKAKKTFHDHHQLKDLKGVSYSLENNHEKWVETIDINYKSKHQRSREALLFNGNI